MLTFPVLDCRSCRRQFGLLVGTGTSSLDSLPDPFQAICIHCEAVSPYRKAEVNFRTLGAETAK